MLVNDLSKIKPIERTIEISNPGTGAPVGVRVRVMSIEDDRLKKLKRNFTDERLKLESKGKSLKSEEIERNSNMLLFKSTLGWEWYNPTGSEGDEGYNPEAMPEFEGEQPEYNQRNFMDIITTIPWFGSQIAEEIDETKAFFDNSNGS